MTTVAFTINGKPASVEADADTPLLWIIREHIKLTGTKFGCGAGLCGACTIHINGKAVRSCQTQLSEVANKKVTTTKACRRIPAIRCRKHGLPIRSRNAGTANRGRLCRRPNFLAKNPKPTREQIVQHMDGNICRCGTYAQIIEAIQSVA